MKKSKAKIVVKPLYIGSEPFDKIFKRVIKSEIERKIKVKNGEKYLTNSDN